MSNQIVPVNLPANRPEITSIVSYPQYTLRGINSWEQVMMVGANNIARIISSARDFEKSLSGRIGKLTEQRKLLEGKTGADFVAMASEFENPTDMEVGHLPNNWGNDLEPVDPKSQARKSDATTFNICGWCKHSGGGTCRYNYHISTSCNLLRSGETKFDTPCLLHKTSEKDIAVVVEDIKEEIEQTKEKREQVRAGIRILQGLKESATEKPYLMSLRSHDHFNVGDAVVIYIRNYEDKIVDGCWTTGTVVFGYRHHDGCTSYQTEFPIHKGEYLEGRGGGAGMSRPEVLLKSEFEYLAKAATDEPEFAKLWLANLDDHLKGFNASEFMQSVIEGSFANPPEDWTPPSESIPVNTVEDAMRVLNMLCEPESEKEVHSWVKMQLRYVHPDKHERNGDAVKAYAERQTKAVYDARDLLLARLRDMK